MRLSPLGTYFNNQLRLALLPALPSIFTELAQPKKPQLGLSLYVYNAVKDSLEAWDGEPLHEVRRVEAWAERGNQYVYTGWFIADSEDHWHPARLGEWPTWAAPIKADELVPDLATLATAFDPLDTQPNDLHPALVRLVFPPRKVSCEMRVTVTFDEQMTDARAVAENLDEVMTAVLSAENHDFHIGEFRPQIDTIKKVV